MLPLFLVRCNVVTVHAFDDSVVLTYPGITIIIFGIATSFASDCVSFSHNFCDSHWHSCAALGVMLNLSIVHQ